MALSTDEQKILNKLIKEYNDDNWSVLCSLDQFLISKKRNNTKPYLDDPLFNIVYFRCIEA
jgi:hypothetical protein